MGECLLDGDPQSIICYFRFRPGQLRGVGGKGGTWYVAVGTISSRSPVYRINPWKILLNGEVKAVGISNLNF